ncbi:MAG: hypothetical protein UY92_C0005G0034 [Candidatus Magasanikbacteria bacterium GW2011_GWA2_56_11]|uniref:N-acetyltransferase domain-containing protein n=1 Tax=Candidatus Magasanikbacteria bacterium GW2011_GWA2_56_11 TaxID=1619044 RepID=A0A0G2AMT9_9BACT|nr:MAG: hypothetical protein UY92_C0005G0034 [Candidatus Magasanikbacteria bacterium GW2011_GWA2_56_11]
MLGWALLVVIANERHAEPYGLMENVYVEREHRGKGIGTKLVELVISEAKERGCYKLLATSRHGKPEVHTLYERFGFANHGVEFRMNFIDSEPKQRD